MSAHALPHILFSVATVGRRASLARLIDSLALEARASRYPGRLGVQVVHNHEEPIFHSPDPETVAVRRVHVRELSDDLCVARRLGLLPGEWRLPLSIGEVREAQVVALRRHLKTPVEGLPHPDQGRTLIWMLDDDLVFAQLDETNQVSRHLDLLRQAARYAFELPYDVVVGTFTGDPPVPGLDCLGGQLHDLQVAIEQMANTGPRARWEPGPPALYAFDAYYDLSESGGRLRTHPFRPWDAGRPVTQVASSLLRDLPRLRAGAQLTRPLTWRAEEQRPRATLRRGGNTLFLNPDALFRWPTPVLACSDGVVTRRADTLWATLAHREQPKAVVEAPLPLLHCREGQAPVRLDARGLARKTSAQVRGVALARALLRGSSVADELRSREERVRVHRSVLAQRLMDFRRSLAALGGWGLDALLDRANAELELLQLEVQASMPIPGDPAELRSFLDILPRAVDAWRCG